MKTSDKEQAYGKVYRAEHRVEIAAHRKKHRVRNKEYALAYRATHGEEHRMYQAKYQRENPEVMAAGAANYRHRKRGNGGSFSRSAWEYLKVIFGRCCAYCGKRIDLTQDHVVPVSKGGWHFGGNIVPACRSCNSSKGNGILW